MKWRLLNTGFNSGAYNMKFDLDLVNSVKPSEAFLRFYRWKPYCISLGHNQKIDDINPELAKADKIDIVKRPTGGRAILHAEELTYSVILPNESGLTNEEIYNLISNALVKGLIFYNPVFKLLEQENLQPDFKKEYGKPQSILCFSSTARHEIKFDGKKLIGSAQRRMLNGLLQHGSILVGDYHKNIVKYLNVPPENKKLIEKITSEKTTEISSILKKEIEYEELTAAIARGFESVWGIKFYT